MSKKLKRISSGPLPLFLILGLASFLRFFRLSDLLGFWYDQGRDALVIWDFIHNGKFFLIGPTTGIEGVFRGPWYYWIITPFYWLGNGNPIYPSVFLILTSILAIYFLYKVGEKLGGKKLGLISAFIASCSDYVIGISRWLSNPVPMLLISILIIWSVFAFLEKKKWALPFLGFLVGMSLQFGSSTEFFYIPVLIVILIWKRKLLPNTRTIIFSLLLLVASFIPQTIFEFRHHGVLSGAAINFLLHGKTIETGLAQLIVRHLEFYYNLIASKFWINGNVLFAPFLIIITLFMLVRSKEFKKNDKFLIVLMFSIAPLIGTLFFKGNSGNLYDYYFTGYYFIFILVFVFVLLKMSETKWGKVILSIFLLIFVFKNFNSYKTTYFVSLDKPNLIAFKNQTDAVGWVYSDANGQPFNVDVYVPPVIPYAYEYLFKWLGAVKYGQTPLDTNVSLLYTLSEVDPDHPGRIKLWRDRQSGIGKIDTTVNFGGITVEKRTRIAPI